MSARCERAHLCGRIKGQRSALLLAAAAAVAVVWSKTATGQNVPTPASGTIELIVDPTTGDVMLDGNGADIVSLQVTSASDSILPGNWLDLNSHGYTNWADTARKTKGIGEYDTQFTVDGDSLILTDTVDYGNIFNTTGSEDLIFEYGELQSNGTTIKTLVGNVIYQTPPVSSGPGDQVYLQQPVAADWNSTADALPSWFDTTASSTTNFPSNGSSVYVLQSGTIGVSNTQVNYNQAYPAPGISALYVDSGNVINQTSGTSTLYVNGNVFLGNNSNSFGAYNQTAGIVEVLGDLHVGYLSSSGSYTLGGGNLLVGGTTYLGYGATGAFNQSGGSNTTTGLCIGSSNNASTVYSMSGGVLISQTTVNSGQITQSGGTANLGVVTGNGTMMLSGGLTQATSVQQTAVTLNAGSYLNIASNAAQLNNSITTLTINGSGELGLANQSLITSTTPATVRQYLINGYNGGAWNGTGGIRSSSINVGTLGPVAQNTAFGYVSGTSSFGAAVGLSPGQTLVKYTVDGDANLDGAVNTTDLNAVLNNYLSGNAPTWDTGDFTYAGKTDITDLDIVLNNFQPSATQSISIAALGKATLSSKASAAPKSLGASASPSVAFGTVELDVNTANGDVTLNADSANIVSLQITSASGALAAGNWTSLSANTNFANWSLIVQTSKTLAEYNNIFATQRSSLSLNGLVNYGDIFDISDAKDLVFEYGETSAGGTTVMTVTGSVVYGATSPQPAPSSGVFLQKPTSADWNSTQDSTPSWIDLTAGSTTNLPSNGSSVYVMQSGTVGVANTVVNFNQAYASPGIAALYIDSGNQINQSSGTSALYVSGSVYVGANGSSSATYNQTGGIANIAGNLYVGYLSSTGLYKLGGGSLSVGGTTTLATGASLQQTGGSNTTAALNIAPALEDGGYYLSNGVLSAQSTTNNGLFSQSGGTATLGVISGTGTLGLSGGLTKVTSFAQNAVTVSNTGDLAVAFNTTQFTKTATSLTITASARLDLANQSLLTNTSPSLVRQYLVIGYDSGYWNGAGGINSSAAASSSGTMSLGYTSGTSAVGAALGLSTNQTLVKYVPAGDANLDGKVNGADLSIVLANYLSFNIPTWDNGDFTYAFKTDISDLNIVLNNYQPAATQSAAVALPVTKLSAPKASVAPAAVANGSVSPSVAAGALELDVNTQSGDVTLSGNEAGVVSLQITSASGALQATNWTSLSSNSAYPNWTNTAHTSTGLGEYDAAFISQHAFATINGTIDYGDIFNTRQSEDLVFEYGSFSNGVSIKTLTGNVVYTPKPVQNPVELLVNPVTGDVQLVGNNADIASLQITSASGGIITANWTDLHANGYTNWSDTAKKKTGIGEYDNQFTATGDYAVLGTVDYGDIYNTTTNVEDLVFKYGEVESNDTTVDTDTGSVIYIGPLPEPTMLSFMGLAAAGLLGRRRRSRIRATPQNAPSARWLNAMR